MRVGLEKMSVGSYKNAAILLSGLFFYDGEFSRSMNMINCEPFQSIPDRIRLHVTLLSLQCSGCSEQM